MPAIPGYRTHKEFAEEHGLEPGTVKRQMLRGCCAWPRITVDGRKQHPLYKCYRSMIDRCATKGHTSYPKYGGRGIKVCSEWRENFWQFVEDMGFPPSPQHSLDRRNPEGDYCKDNCHWATKAWQSYNQRTQRNNTSGRRGLSYNTHDDLWRAQLRYDYVHYVNNYFKTREEAEAALDAAEAKLMEDINNVKSSVT